MMKTSIFLEGNEAFRMLLHISMMSKETDRVDTNYTYEQCNRMIPTIPSHDTPFMSPFYDNSVRVTWI